MTTSITILRWKRRVDFKIVHIFKYNNMSENMPVWIGMEFTYKKVSKWTEETPITMGKYLTWVILAQVNFSSAFSAKGL